jgi:hypothetical protein
MHTKLRWYSVQMVRWLSAVIAVIGGLWVVYRLPVPHWAQLILDAVLVTGVIGGSLVMGPVTYTGHQALKGKLREGREAGPPVS